MRRILFVSEAVTLAHIARPLALIGALDARRFETVLACDDRCAPMLRDFHGERRSVASIGSDAFLSALAAGRPIYDEATLRRYAEADLALIKAVQPDLVVGDFRLSLSASARLANVPYLAICNAYWSPYHADPHYTVPGITLTKFLPIPIANALFRAALPVAFALHCRPMNAMRESFGLPSLGHDLRRVYTDADVVAYADAPGLYRMSPLPVNHAFVGPVLWSPPVDPPDWWEQLPADRPIIYVTLGSSGSRGLFGKIIAALAEVDVTVMAASADPSVRGRPFENVFVEPFLPGEAAARRARIVICNGGSPTSQQALSAGVPVIGVVGNMDQFLNMAAVCDAGAGSVIRADRFSAAELRGRVGEMLGARGFADAAGRLARHFAEFDARVRFAELVETALAAEGR